MNLPEYVTLRDINRYYTLSNKWRAYVIGYPSLQAWGVVEKEAIINLGKLLASKGIPFDMEHSK